MDLKSFPGVVVEKFGVHNINPLGAHLRSTDAAYLDSFNKAVANARSRVVDLGLGEKRFYSPDAPEREAAVKYGCHWIDIATIIGSPSVRQHIGGKPWVKADIAVAAAALGKLAEYGAKRNVVINLENDDPRAEDPFFLASVIEKADNPFLRGLPDFGNSLMGHDDDYNRRAVARMLQHAYNMCHIKDEVESDAGVRQKVDLKPLFRLAEESGFKGYYSMECDTRLSDPFAKTKQLVDETLANLANKS